MRPLVIWSLACLLPLFIPAAESQPAAPDAATLGAKAGQLEIAFRRQPGGLKLAGLRDDARHRELLARDSPPLFEIVLRSSAPGREARLDAGGGWNQVSWKTAAGPRMPSITLRWAAPTNANLRGISVTAAARGDPALSAWRWKLRVENSNRNWGIVRVAFPQIALADLGDGAAVAFPRGPGETQTNVWRRPFHYDGDYPGGWCSMQWMAAYPAAPDGSGFYFGMHDAWGSVKEIHLASRPRERSVIFSFEIPPPDLGEPGRSFGLSGSAVWRLFRGDWFDAAQIYKAWAREHARWQPALTAEGRADTPLWMRELSLWAMTGGAPSNCVERVKRFQQFIGLPIGFHWYNWHQIPFDNDYPHYFPAKPGFASAVAELEKSHVHVMPYINGRLWDTHDRGTNDFEFTKLALPAAAKQADGRPYIESYGSKEADGERVRLAVMCPATERWQETIRRIVLRLFQEDGTSAVYIDQVAAAPPKLCMDRAHGHPLGGGHWWNEGYWTMLEKIRRAKPPGTMLTTECNGEPFLNQFDGYLTWHWQYNGQVPAFPAVYGGAIQMFGRAYRGGPSKDLALRMKAGQQLVFGEQIGWLDPDQIQGAGDAQFIRQIARLRWRFRRYFYAGEMDRPPAFAAPPPMVEADWQWSGHWPVTAPAALSGAWRIAREKRMVWLFVNVSDAPVAATGNWTLAKYGIPAATLRVAEADADALDSAQELPGLPSAISLAPRQARAWELHWK